MKGNLKHEVSSTAFVVNYSRSRMEDISHDTVVKYWVTPEAISLYHELEEKAFKHDDLNVSLRTRFYLEILKKFILDNENPVFIDIASGFDNFPFLVEDQCSFVEIDLPHILEYKQYTLNKWMDEEKIPIRKIDFFPIDLMELEDHEKIKCFLKQKIRTNPSLIILQGITYYLNKEILSQIIYVFNEVQEKGSLIALDYWTEDSLELEVMISIKKFLDERFGYQGKELNLLEESYFETLPGYEQICSTKVEELELKYSSTRIFQGRDNKIPVHFKVLKKL